MRKTTVRRHKRRRPSGGKTTVKKHTRSLSDVEPNILPREKPRWDHPRLPGYSFKRLAEMQDQYENFENRYLLIDVILRSFRSYAEQEDLVFKEAEGKVYAHRILRRDVEWPTRDRLIYAGVYVDPRSLY